MTATNRATAAYGSPQVDVEGILGSDISPDDPDRAIIEPWAQAVGGRILDVGSGTGRWTGHLARLGHRVEGLEPAERLNIRARKRHPSVVFHHGSVADLAGTTSEWDGILAWYSLIHMGADDMAEALATLRTALADGGGLLMSFFSGPRLTAFDHPIATAYRWPVEDMASAVNLAGFDVVESRSNPYSPHTHISALAMAR